MAQYFEPRPSAPSRQRSIELTLPDVYLELTTDAGVFSADGVDKGTRYLLRDHPPFAGLGTSPQTILDVGCGYGPIALTAAKRLLRADVWGVDVNERALALARGNAKANSIDTARFVAPDDVPEDLRFDLILSNPPIRIGKTKLRELLQLWLDRLSPEGRAWMVVQKHLGSDSLATWLTDNGWATSRLSSRSGFRILETLPREAPPTGSDQ